LQVPKVAGGAMEGNGGSYARGERDEVFISGRIVVKGS
jgi:hypothetical protein